MSPFRTLGLAAALAAFTAGAGFAQTAGPSRGVGAEAVGHWIYDQNGSRIGSVRSLSRDGGTATLMIGSYFQQGSHEAQVPVSALTVVDGRVVVQPTVVEALNTSPRR